MSDAPKSEGPLATNPPRRKSISGFGCLALTAILVVSLSITLYLVTVGTDLVTRIFVPHHDLYQIGTASPDARMNPALVVQPLITREQSFDVAVTVWLRKGEGNGETPLYSDVVFRDMRLKDKDVFSTVSFTVPTAYFKGLSLTNYDLRASVVLIPKSPSLLDHITDHSSWMPYNPDAFPMRAWPFPLSSPSRGKKTAADKAIESFGVTVPLIQFHRISSQCGDDEYLEEEMMEQDEENDITTQLTKPALLESTDSKPVLAKHPYIVTRTQIRVLDDAPVLNRKAYSKAHQRLKKTSCGQGAWSLVPDKFLCDRSYTKVGPLETELKLALPDKSTGKVQTAWAYAPHISVSKFAAGPKDLVPVPVDREACFNDLDPEPKSVNISWKLSFSGRTYKKLVLVDMFDTPQGYENGRSDHLNTLAQDQILLTQGIVGHKFSEDSHPRRRFFLTGLQSILAMAYLVLEVCYWYTRKSTVSISIFGTVLLAAAAALEELAPTIARGLVEGYSWMDWVFVVLLFPLDIGVSLAMIRASFRIRFRSWRGYKWIPVIYTTNKTHAERASERLDAQVSWAAKAGLLLSAFTIYYYLAPHNYYIVAPLLPAPSEGDYNKSWLMDSWPFVAYPMYVTGKLLQLYLNWRSGTYAGMYWGSAVLILIVRALFMMEFVPVLVGSFEARPMMVAHALVDFALLTAGAWQAVTLPAVSQVEEAEHLE